MYFSNVNTILENIYCESANFAILSYSLLIIKSFLIFRLPFMKTLLMLDREVLATLLASNSNKPLNPKWHEGWYFSPLVLFGSDFVS